MKLVLHHGGIRISAMALVCLIALASLTLPVGHTLWSETLGVSGAVSLQEQDAGTSVEVTNRTTSTRAGLASLNLSQSSSSVNGEICVSNHGESATQDLAITVQLEAAVSETDFQPLEGAAQSFLPSRQLSPDESGCFPYSIEFIPTQSTQYRSTVYVTITNFAGWVAPSENCPGPDQCPFGPSASAPISLDGWSIAGKEPSQTPVPSPTVEAYPETEIEAQLEADSRRLEDTVDVTGLLAVKNTGSLPTEGLVVSAQVFAASEDSDPVRAASELWEWRSETALPPGETVNLPFLSRFTPLSGERYIIQARIRIDNHAGWMVGSAKCPGPQICPHGPTIRLWLEFPENTLVPTFTPTRTPTASPTPTSSATSVVISLPTAAPTFTFTPAPSNTAEPTLIPPTSTPVPTQEDTEAPVFRETPTPAPTETAVPTETPIVTDP